MTPPVTAVIVTRGDVDLAPIVESLIWPHAIWDNARLHDWGAYGRYVAATLVKSPLIYVQDDDCIVPPDVQRALLAEHEPGVLVSNMNPNHNAGMPLLALPGWGAIFDRHLPAVAFEKWAAAEPDDDGSDDFFRVGCDIVFPVLTPSRMVDLGHENLPHAWDAHRTHVQPGYKAKKDWYYRRATEIRG
jgi:hypothetical protein